MAKQSAIMILADKIARRIIAEQTFPRLAIGLDSAMIAAHRVFGMGPERAKRFDAAYKEAMDELAGLFLDDADENHDKSLTYAKVSRDDLIQKIVGPDLFVPFDQIYGDAYIDELRRVRIIGNKEGKQ